MKRFGKIATVLATCMLVASPALAAEKVRWKLAMSWSSTLTPLAAAAPKLADMVSKMSGGNFEIRVEGAEKHKAALGILDMVKGGQYEMGHSASYYWKGKDISSVFFTTVPFGMTSNEQYAWFYYGDGQTLQDKAFEKFDVLSYPGGNTGVQMGGWFKKEIASVDDLKGLKMRIPGVAGEIFAKLGVAVTNIPPGELYTSLDRGTIDALEWVGPGMDIKMGFHKIAPYYYTGWHEPGAEMHYLINKKAFEQLSPEYQAILTTAIKAVTADQTAMNFDANARAWAQIKAEYPDIKIMSFPPAVLKEMKKANDEVMSDYAAKDPLFKEIWENQKAYMADVREWTRMSDYLYIKTVEALQE
ncbi:TRAP transporter substrate-binding protein [Desulfopila aestuarii]|uniref:TRAP-type mannitol/chloroaromatic compound transport system, substrate-binding protein n=1 Tax=Desulfopila aestuarii DSM 18488 TaxID=1121416 RepID=A0A1M7Y9D1_9BACT|nr:TRAP transporter substrate-binding protein [Desulfopila aestuarii]SHO49244.1 TRAP-type mannitol/chloroaromatic compound transport system, substrate-binding protein [Desulfopila aestuarii DSM 18488]